LVLSGGKFLAGGKKFDSVFWVILDMESNLNDLNN
jgi:hypothetical protein